MREFIKSEGNLSAMFEDSIESTPVADPVKDYSLSALQAHCDAINNFIDNDNIEAKPIINFDRHNSIALYLYGKIVHEWIYLEFGDRRYLTEDAGRIYSIISKSIDAAKQTAFGDRRAIGELP